MAGAEDTLKDFWTSRPRRPRKGRVVAGVAAAIANRYAIDPVIVRIVLVVATVFGGAGLMVYLLGWLFFPEETDEESPMMAMLRQGRSSTGWFFTLLLCGVAFGAALWTFSGTEGNGLIGMVLLVAALYLLHRSRGDLGRAAVTQPMQPVMPTQAQPTMPLGTPLEAQMNAPASEPEPRTGPPAWDPLGAAPFAWDLPEPAPVKDVEPETPTRRTKSRVGGITLGAALAVGGGLALLAPYAPWLSVGHIVGVVLAIIGLGMVGGSFVRGGRGLIGLAVPLAMAGFVFTNTTVAGPSPAGFDEQWGNISSTPTTVESVAPSYSAGGGTIDLDLTALPATGIVRTQVHVGLGNVAVIVPPTADVDFTCQAGVGSVECLGQERNAVDVRISGVDYGTDGPGSGLKIFLDARAGSGTVEVRRG